MMMGDYNSRYNEGFYNETDGLVPTTVGRQPTDYDGTFYQQHEKGMMSGNTSGTNTPSAYSEDPLDLINMTLEYGVATMPTYELQTQGQTTTPRQLTDCSSLGTSEESSEEDSTDKKDIPEILKRPVKGMSSDDKKLRRRELNRLAARRSRQKKRTNASSLEKEAARLKIRNAQLREELSELETSKASLYDAIKIHFKRCGDDRKFNNNSNHRVASAKQEATSCSVPKAPTVPAADSAYGNRTVGISGSSLGYSECYD